MKVLYRNFLITCQLCAPILIISLSAESDSKKEEDKYWEARRIQMQQEQQDYDRDELENRQNDNQAERKQMEDQIQRRKLERQQEDRRHNR